MHYLECGPKALEAATVCKLSRSGSCQCLDGRSHGKRPASAMAPLMLGGILQPGPAGQICLGPSLACFTLAIMRVELSSHALEISKRHELWGYISPLCAFSAQQFGRQRDIPVLEGFMHWEGIVYAAGEIGLWPAHFFCLPLCVLFGTEKVGLTPVTNWQNSVCVCVRGAKEVGRVK